MEKVYVFGHRKPDTDSVSAAIALAYLKKQMGINAIPVILSSINNETKYALDYFKVDEPLFLNDVKTKIKDVKYKKNYFINENKTLIEAYNMMVKENSSKLPIVDNENVFKGVLAMKEIAKYLISNTTNLMNTTYDNIVSTINGEEILKFDNDIKGNVLVASYKSTTFIDNVNLTNDNILIVGDRHSIIEYAINSNIKLLILSGNSEIKEKHLRLAKKKKVNIIRTKFFSLETAQMIRLSNTVKDVYPKINYVCANESDNVSDFINLANKTKYSYYPVINNSNKCLGLITLADTSERKKKKVILVDHNSIEQTVEGIEDANILEVVDHHNIGSIGTTMPISFRNMPVGSTNTILYQMYKEQGVIIPKEIAGLMASGIISDTLILTSPTTTELDKEALEKLSKKAKIDYKKYGLDMLKAGASIKGKTKEELIYQDFKIYPIGDKKMGIGQLSTTDPSLFVDEKKEYEKILNEIAISNDYLLITLFVTDILNNGSYIFYNDNAKEILEKSFNVENLEQGYFLKDVMSRKLQIVPAILEEEK